MDITVKRRCCALVCFLSCTLALHSEEPWGKDLELIHPPTHRPPQKTGFFQKVGVAMIRFHQDVISPADGPRSHYMPSSSQYTLEAISKYGLLQGVALGCDRLMRENDDPWVYSTCIGGDGMELKVDPVP